MRHHFFPCDSYLHHGRRKQIYRFSMLLCSCNKKEEREDGRKETELKVTISSKGTIKDRNLYDHHYKLSGVWVINGTKKTYIFFDSDLQYHIIFAIDFLGTCLSLLLKTSLKKTSYILLREIHFCGACFSSWS